MGAAIDLIKNAIGRIGPLRDALRRVRGFVQSHRARVWFLEGPERSSGERLGILYMGQLGGKKYIEHLAFAGVRKQDDLGAEWIWNAARRTRCRCGIPDLIVMDLEDRHYRRFADDRGFYIPVWTGGELVLPETLAKWKPRENSTRDPRRIKGGNRALFGFEVTKKEERFEHFYFTMYVPYVIEAHGNRAFVEPYEQVRMKMDRSELHLVKQGDEYVAGAIVVHEEDRLHAWMLGVKDGNHDHVKAGAIAAMYYYQVLYFSAKGYERIYVGLTRAFLTDGVLQFKKQKWGLCLTGTGVARGFWLRWEKLSPGAKAFLINNPFIARTGTGLSGAAFMQSGNPAGEQPLRELHRNYFVPGMEKLNIYLLGERVDDVVVPDDLAASIAIKPAPIFSTR